MPTEPPRVLITGGAGFLGSHLCDRFLKEGWRVVALDNLLTGSVEHIAHLMGHERFRFIHYNVTHYLYFAEPIDLILHFACPASPLDYAQFPIQTMKVDSLGTLNSLGLARAKGSRYVFASTSEVYGDPREHPQKESYWGHVNPVGPRSVYTESKRFSEAMCMAYHRHHNLDVRIARIFNTYGTRMRLDDGRVIPTFIARALRCQPLVLNGDGSQTRSFCHVDDMVDGLVRLSVQDDLNGVVVNLGNPEEVTIRSLAERILELSKGKGGIERRGMPGDDPARRRPDISLARHLLDFAPHIDLDTGLSGLIPWVQEKLKAELKNR
ncbi:MAG: SDR family oxidoreductase [Candidatus Aminicenantes bacterium]|nr:SDR family oxidoreductase [Candidatus Aminicenantes bacterium]